MSVRYRPVQWNRLKLVYDALLLAFVIGYISVFQSVARALFRGAEALSAPILAMRAWGSCAFLLLSGVLCIGPLSRLDPRFLPLLYNRRHAGVLMSLVALGHAYQVLGFYFAWGKQSELTALFSYDTRFTAASVPFIAFGLAALLIVLVMAVTSHDFWQKFLGASAWKSLHMSVYVAYALVVVHVAFGALQRERNPGFAVLFVSVALTVVVLHVLAGWRASADDVRAARMDGAWFDVGPVYDLADGRAQAVCPPGAERIALVRQGDLLYAVHGVCAHQRGPLYEGRVKDGCLTCPWHGWQYRAEDGRSPPPFEEQLPTYRLRAKDGRVLVDTRPLPPGTKTEPVRLAALRGGVHG
jgi:nitrite reductase/ring-hydroxylating ferredoxin subunit/DMSO/TMAO reductase YedYZ heme-binding membrane subunit